jgi:hypothetical protein
MIRGTLIHKRRAMGEFSRQRLRGEGPQVPRRGQRYQLLERQRRDPTMAYVVGDREGYLRDPGFPVDW